MINDERNLLGYPGSLARGSGNSYFQPGYCRIGWTGEWMPTSGEALCPLLVGHSETVPDSARILVHSSIVALTRSVMTAGSSSKANNTVRLNPCGPVMTTRTPPRNGSAAIQPSYCSLTCLPPASIAVSIRSRRVADSLCGTQGAGHRCVPVSAHIVPLFVS